MATIASRAEILQERTTYHLVRRAQASIAGYRHFCDGDLSLYLERDSFQSLAGRLADHYFHKSIGLAIHGQVKELYLAHLVMAPILQLLPLSHKYDWQRGHMLSWFRCNCSGRIKRFHFASRTVERDFQPAILAENLDVLGIHDTSMTAFLLDLYSRHAGGTTLKDMLGHQLFDPILMMKKEGFTMRTGNRLFQLEREPFDGSNDLRQGWNRVLEFGIRSVEHRGGRHLEIILSEELLASFRTAVKRILDSSMAPARKLQLLEDRIRDFIEKARWARTAKPQIEELRRWLADKVRPLTGTQPEAKHLPNQLLTLWFQRSDHQLHLKVPTFFLDPRAMEEKTYMAFFSPFREVAL